MKAAPNESKGLKLLGVVITVVKSIGFENLNNMNRLLMGWGVPFKD